MDCDASHDSGSATQRPQQVFSGLRGLDIGRRIRLTGQGRGEDGERYHGTARKQAGRHRLLRGRRTRRHGRLLRTAETLDGRPYNNTYCQVIRVRDGQFIEVKEYFDTALVAEVFGND